MSARTRRSSLSGSSSHCHLCPCSLCLLSSTMAFAPDDTKPGHLPPFEVAKAYAFHEALDAISRHLDTPVFELLGERSSVFIAKHLAVKGGGAPTERAVRKAIKRCQDGSWWPGKPPANKGGRPCQIPMSQKLSLAEGSMGLKRALITPGRLQAQKPFMGWIGCSRKLFSGSLWCQC